MIELKQAGNWRTVIRTLGNAARNADATLARTVRQEAHRLRTIAVQGITKQAPGGNPVRALATLTLAKRRMQRFGGTKALMVRADLRNSIAVVLRGDSAFVGVSRTARGKDGESLVNVAEVHEFGFRRPKVVRMTPRMRWYLMALLRRAGVPRKRRTEAVGSHSRVVVLTIPPRPFMQPAWDVFHKGLRERVLTQLSKLTSERP